VTVQRKIRRQRSSRGRRIETGERFFDAVTTDGSVRPHWADHHRDQPTAGTWSVP
jgi:hypothetical protein